MLKPIIRRKIFLLWPVLLFAGCVYGQAKEFLNKLASVIQAGNLELQLMQQNETVMKAEKRYNSLVDDGADLNKRKNVNEQKLQSNKNDQDKQNAEVEREKQAFTLLVRQR